LRLLLLLLVVAIVIAVVLSLLRRVTAAPRRARRPLDDELVKDPVCQTYVVRSRAIRAGGAAGAPYFCSRECARRYSG
jgi:hypothetical protein